MQKSRILGLLATLLALSSWAQPAGARDAIELESLIRGFGAMPGLSARFREETHLSLLQVPLISEGVLYFAPPDRIARHVERPAPSTLLVRSNELVMGTAGDRHALDLATQPVLRSFVDAFRSVLAGDLAKLRELYEIEFRATDAKGGWQIQLTPRDERLVGMIRSIRLAGRDAILLELGIVDADGDETVTRFSNIDPQRRFSAAELDALFRIPP